MTEQETTVYDTSKKIVGYKIDGRTGTVRMDHDPGERIAVQDGQVQVDG